MTDDDPDECLRAPNCPGCDDGPLMDFGDQRVCGNPQCAVFTWDPHADPATFKARATTVNIDGLFRTPPTRRRTGGGT